MARRQEHPIRHAAPRQTPAAPFRPAPKRLPSPASEQRTSSVASAVVWGGSGFVVGAVFWHLIGFWSFVSTVVLGDTDARRTMAEGQKGWSTQIIGPPSPVRTTSRRPSPPTCTALSIDRASGVTAAKPCPAGSPPTASLNSGKSDKLATAADTDKAEAAAVSYPQSMETTPAAIATSAAKPTQPN